MQSRLWQIADLTFAALTSVPRQSNWDTGLGSTGDGWAVDRLRAAAVKLVRESPDLQRVLEDAGAWIVGRPATGVPPGAQ